MSEASSTASPRNSRRTSSATCRNARRLNADEHFTGAGRGVGLLGYEKDLGSADGILDNGTHERLLFEWICRYHLDSNIRLSSMYLFYI